MKKVFLTLTMLLFAFMGTMKAGVEVEIGSASSTNNYLPTYTYYNYSLTQQIYTAEEIGMPGTINSISFSMASGDDRTRVINLFMKNVTRSEFASNTDWELFEDEDALFSGEVTFTQGWVTIELETPFEYNGTDNLLVCVQDATGSYQSAPSFDVFSSTSAAIRAYRDPSIFPVNNPGANGTILNVKNYIKLDMDLGPANVTANPSSLDMGMRPNGAWMAPKKVVLSNGGQTAVVSDVATSNDFFVVDAEVPFTLSYDDDPVEIQVTTGTGTAGTQEGSIVVTYTDRSTTVIPVTATAYTPAAGDVWENAVEVNTFPYNETAPADIYHNYELPEGDPDAADAMYKVTFDQDVLLTANAAGTNGVAALYAEDFAGQGGPGVNNVFSAGVNIAPVDYWFPGYEYTGDNTFFGTSSGGGFIWGYKVAPEYLAGYGQCYLTQVSTAAREAYPYNLYVLRGGDTPEEAEMIYYQEMEGDAEPMSFFTMDLTAPFEVGEDENLWVFFYSASPYAGYCGKVPTDAENGKVWYTLDGSTWYSNEEYTPVIGLHLQFPNPGGRSVVLDLADMSVNEFNGNGSVGESKGTLAAVKRNRDSMISDMFVPAGTYYLAMASTTPSFGVNISTAEVPAPEQAVIVAPEDGALGVDNGDLLQWTLGDYTSEFQILLGTQFPPTDVYVDWTNYLYESMELENLLHNKTYFVQINARNSMGTTMGEITGFTTVIDGVEGFTVESDKLYPGDAAVFSWEAPARMFRGYNLYKDGEKVNETPISGTTYSVEGLEYNMDGYAFQLAVVYDEGESELTEPIIVYMTGNGSINGHVWEMDSITPVYNVAIQLIGLDEYGIEQTLSIPGTTNPSGYFEGEALTGTYQAIGVKEGYQANPSVEFVIENTLLTPDINVYALEDWAPLGTIRATEEEDDVLVEWSWDPASMIVDFETGDFSQAEFDNTISSYPWTVTTSNPYEGTYSMKSTCEGVNSATSAIQVTVDVPYDGKMGFYLRVSSESNYDKFHFYIDGTEQGQAISGTLNYTYKEYAVTEGTHTYKWEYTKDSSVNSGDDCVNVDNITMYRQDIPVPPTPGATVYDFEDGIQGWTSLDANNDGYGWVLGSEIGGVYLAAGASLEGSGHNMSNNLVCSGSFSNATGAAITPDNYLVSPAKISAHSGASINFWACAQDASYAAEHFGVAVSTGSNSNASDFTTIQEWTMTAKGPQGRTAETEFDIRGTRDQGTWYQYNVDLSSYAGQEIWVAVRHFNCNDQFILNVDDITLADGSAKLVAKGPRQDRTIQKFYLYRRNTYTGQGDTLVETLGSFGLNTFDYIDNQWNNLPYGEYQWGIQAYYEGNHHYPEKGRETVTYGFEGNMDGWTTIDADGDGYNWALGSVLMAGYSIPSYDGEDCVTSQSYDASAGALTPDNYLVSPAKAEYSSISFWACAQDPSYPAEHFGVAVSTASNTNASDFTTIQEWTMTAKGTSQSGNYMGRNRGTREGTWYQFTVDLSSYAGQEIWVAIRHFNCTDMFYIDVDEITLTSDGGVTPPDPPTPPTPGTGGSLTIDFETGDFNQYEFDNTSSYPWQVVAGGADGSAYCMKSTNAGVASSESAISATVEYVQDGTVSFDANCQGEGTSTIWDKCRFFIDGAEQFSYGANVSGWHNYSFNVTAGSHLFTWSYSKDSSVNPTGDCFQVDNIVFDGVAGGPGPNGGANGYSEILWSNVIDKDMEQEVTFNIALNNNQSPAGATLTMVGPSTYNATFDETGTYVFDALRRGVYDITVELAGYATIETTMALGEYDTYSILMEEILAPVEDLYVSATGWAMWENSLVTSGPTIGDGGSITGGGGSTPTPPGPPTPPGSGDSFTEGFESGMPAGWTVIDANNDGMTWCLTSAIPATWTYYASLTLDWYRTGTNAICSGSYINGVGALTPDEYLVTSQVTLTSGSTFSFWAAATDASYPADHFGVFVSDNGTSGWTMVNEWTLTGKSNGNGGRASRDGNGAKLGSWHQFSVDLSAYAGDMYIAIRHFNCNDQYIMCVDDIELSNGTKSAPAHAEACGTHIASAPARNMWDLLGSFTGTSAGQQAVATDGEYVYTASWQTTPTGGHTFYQYTMDGTFVEGFEITGATGIRDLTFDGEYFYGSSGGAQIFILDFTNRTLVGTINCSGLTSRHLSYDPERDGFWSGNWTTLALYSRTGAVIQTATAPESAYGSAYYKDEEDVEHLFLFCQPNSDAKVYDYNIATNTISSTPVFDFAATPGFDGIAGGCFIGNYGDKLAFYGNSQQDPNLIGIYEIAEAQGEDPNQPGNNGGSQLETNDHYFMIYRQLVFAQEMPENEEDLVVLLADQYGLNFADTSYVDNEYAQLTPGTYKYGVAAVYPWIARSDNNVTPIVWSNNLDKDMATPLTVNVVNALGEVAGTVVTLTNLAENISYSEELDETGVLTIEDFRKGDYNLTVTLDGYIAEIEGELIPADGLDMNLWYDNPVINVNLIEYFAPVNELIVSQTGFARWTDMLPNNRLAQRYHVLCDNIFQGETENNYMILNTENLVNGQTYTAEVAVIYSTGMSEFVSADFTYMTCDYVNPQVEELAATVDLSDVTLTWNGGTPTPPGPPTPPGQGDTFTEGFENGMPSGWTVIDANNDGMTWCLTSAIPATWTYYASLTLDWYRTGTNAICSGSYINGVGALTPDEYLVTSQVTLTSGSTFSFWAAATDASYPADHFGVFVSDNGTSGWTMVNEWTLTGKSNGNGGRASRDGNGAKLGSWHQFSVDLSAFAGQKYIAIRHFNCNDQYIMCVDDLELASGKSSNTFAAAGQGFGLANHSLTDDGNWYYYDNGINDDAIGTGGGNFWWGVMFPAGTYQGNKVTKVAAFDYMAMTGTASIYQGGSNAPAGSALGQVNVTFTGSTDFVEFTFAEPVEIDPSQNVWVVLYNGNAATYPAAVCANTGDANGRWVSLDGSSWEDLASYGLDYTFMVRAYIEQGGSGPGNTTTSITPGAYNIFFDGEFIGATTDTNFTWICEDDLEHEYTVVYVDQNFNMSCPASIIVKADPWSLGQYEVVNAIYPNPTNGDLHVNTNADMKSISIVNVLGQVVYNRVIEGTETIINMAQFDNGIYMVNIVTENGSSVHRVIVSK